VKRLALTACVVLASLTACGGGGASIYTLAATKACLAKAHGVSVRKAPASDFVANSATGGAFTAVLNDNRATVSFGQTVNDADNIDEAYRRFHAHNVGINDVLRSQQNAVMLWHVHPTDADISAITDCLKS
jgi:hypothetical protein